MGTVKRRSVELQVEIDILSRFQNHRLDGYRWVLILGVLIPQGIAQVDALLVGKTPLIPLVSTTRGGRRGDAVGDRGPGERNSIRVVPVPCASKLGFIRNEGS